MIKPGRILPRTSPVRGGSGALAGATLALILTACAQAPAVLPPAPAAAGPEIELQTTPVPLDTANPARQAVGEFRYAGGFAISSPGNTRLQGLSDLKVTPDGVLVVVSDFGDLIEARLTHDAAGRIVGLRDGKMWRLKGLAGQPLDGKQAADAEGLALMPNGDRLISFERDDRIWRYPAAGGPPVVAPMPNTIFSENEGMEGLTHYPAAGPDAYLVGSQEGEVWLCRLSGGCAPFSRLATADIEFGLTALAAYRDGSVVVVHRAFDPARGPRIAVGIYSAAELKKRNPLPMATLRLEGSLTRDNFEGVALITGAQGVSRLLLLSDGNNSPSQRTLLLAFDWIPA